MVEVENTLKLLKEIKKEIERRKLNFNFRVPG